MGHLLGREHDSTLLEWKLLACLNGASPDCIVVVVLESALSVCISTTACACKTVNTNSHACSCRAWRRGRATPDSLPDCQPCPEDHVPHHPYATAEPWHHCDETWDPQQLSTSSRPLDETDNSLPHPARCAGVFLWPNSFNTTKNSPTTKHSTNQARQPSKNNVIAPRNLSNTSKLSNKTLNMTTNTKTPSGDTTCKLTTVGPKV